MRDSSMCPINPRFSFGFTNGVAGQKSIKCYTVLFARSLAYLTSWQARTSRQGPLLKGEEFLVLTRFTMPPSLRLISF